MGLLTAKVVDGKKKKSIAMCIYWRVKPRTLVQPFLRRAESSTLAQSLTQVCPHERSPSRSTSVPLNPVLTSTGFENLEKSHKVKLNQQEFRIRFPNIVILKDQLAPPNNAWNVGVSPVSI